MCQWHCNEESHNILWKGNWPEFARSLCWIQISMPSSNSNIRIKAAIRCAETWRIPINSRFLRDIFEGTNIIAVISNIRTPVKDTYDCSVTYTKAFQTVPKKLPRWPENESARKIWPSLHWNQTRNERLLVNVSKHKRWFGQENSTTDMQGLYRFHHLVDKS